MSIVSVEIVLAGAKALTVIFGCILTYLSFKAYRRTGSDSLGTLAIGIGLLTIGAIFSGLTHLVLNRSLSYSVSIQAVFTAVGFAIMTLSLFTDVIGFGGGRESGGRIER